jgi:hypothetical protein
MKRLILIAAAAALAGCAGLNAQGVLTITYNTPATTTSATLVPGAPAAAASAAK